MDAEIADAALYDELKLVTTHEDLIRVYNRLQSASLNSHLPELSLQLIRIDLKKQAG